MNLHHVDEAQGRSVHNLLFCSGGGGVNYFWSVLLVKSTYWLVLHVVGNLHLSDRMLIDAYRKRSHELGSFHRDNLRRFPAQKNSCTHFCDVTILQILRFLVLPQPSSIPTLQLSSQSPTDDGVPDPGLVSRGHAPHANNTFRVCRLVLEEASAASPTRNRFVGWVGDHLQTVIFFPHH